MTRLSAWILCGLACSVALFGQQEAVPRRKIAVAEYRDKVYASWLGQCAGNIYGLAHEQKYFREPGPDRFPLGYSGRGAQRMRSLNGAFSDDDTDIEYMYLAAMEAHGPEPTYEQLAAFWRRHVRKDVWLANRAAVAAMNYGLTPPWTGSPAVNPHWFQIDPQLVNEIWAVTAPGMVPYAAAKSAWAARVMSDGWAIEPTVHYGAMYAAAFFETDVTRLIEIGKAALPAGSKYAATIDHMIALHRKHPGDWKAARQESLRRLYFEEPEATRTATNAHLNGALGILALLYGGGDFQRTLDLACALGFDADNQAATLSGLLGIAGGAKGIPRQLLFPFSDRDWRKPLNDRYTNVTREGLPDASLESIAERIAVQGERIILAHGGRKVAEGGVDFYEIDGNAAFRPPFEFPIGPPPVIESGEPVDHPFLLVGAEEPVGWRLEGKLPRGLKCKAGRLSGIAHDRPGVYPITFSVRSGAHTAHRRIDLVVRGHNLAHSAERVLAPVQQPDLSLRKLLVIDTPATFFATSAEVLRDGKRTGDHATFLSLGAGPGPRTDAYGYEWASPQTIGLIAFHTGFVEEVSGWFSEIAVEFRDASGSWRPVRGLRVAPPFPGGNNPVEKAHFAEYLMFFEPVHAKAIRITGAVGAAKGHVKDPPLFTSISELGVYGPVHGLQLLH